MLTHAAVVALGRQYEHQAFPQDVSSLSAGMRVGLCAGVTREQKADALLRLCRLAVDHEPVVRKVRSRMLTYADVY
jgi:hypothetical protein